MRATTPTGACAWWRSTRTTWSIIQPTRSRRCAKARGLAFDYLYDGAAGDREALRAERTPEVFLFDRDRRLVYHGAIDDSRDETAVAQHYLRDALGAVLSGEEPAVAETPPIGCTLKWK